MKKTLSLLLAALCLFSSVFCFVGCGKEQGVSQGPTHSKEISYSHFNTVTVLSAYGDISKEEFDGYATVVDEMFERYHRLFDIYFEYVDVNNIKTINKKAGKEPVAVDTELIDFLLYCKELYTLTEGKTNVMLGSVLSVWHDARERAGENGGVLNADAFPSASVLSEASKHTAIDSLVIDKEGKTVFLSDPASSIDVGAVAKGYAAAKVGQKLREMGADSMALNAGGNIITIGLKPGGNKWVTGITNPDKTAENSLACRVEIGETSLVTSGDYERYFVCDGVRYHHIIDPETLMPANYFSSVSIFTDDSTLADALSTALFCMSYEEGLALIERIGGVDALWIYKDGTIKKTDGVHLVR